MDLPVKSFEEIEPILGKASEAFIKLMGFVRVNYIMDEFWDGKNELKFRRSGKTLITIYIKDNTFTVFIIFGKE